ncbi:hypothetical protein OA39_02481 [Vibrio campbellii]|uniref:hypothetical protein n=1 Tax=Vibrio campbellii TaxID=680 RepID=UPI000531B342|nr:hypothetical protein [Vibrio campbellii]KGR35544.1 hypothetical protein OA39_02481 [Vibrio campbellii]
MVNQYVLGADPSGDEYLAETDDEDIIEGFNTICPDSYEEFISAAQFALRKCIKIIEQSANRYYSLGEEELNSLVAGLLAGQSFVTSNEENVRGNVDISVKFGDFKWLIEAKLGKTNNYTFEGLLQILTRYATSEKNFGLLIYYQKRQPLSLFKGWCDYIDNNNWVEYAKANDIYDQLIDLIPSESCLPLFTDEHDSNNMFSKRKLMTSHGSEIDVQFIGVNLYYNPLDTSGRKGIGQKIFHAKQELQESYLNYKDGKEVDMDILMHSIGVLLDESKEFKSLK